MEASGKSAAGLWRRITKRVCRDLVDNKKLTDYKSFQVAGATEDQLFIEMKFDPKDNIRLDQVFGQKNDVPLTEPETYQSAQMFQSDQFNEIKKNEEQAEKIKQMQKEARGKKPEPIEMPGANTYGSQFLNDKLDEQAERKRQDRIARKKAGKKEPGQPAVKMTSSRSGKKKGNGELAEMNQEMINVLEEQLEELNEDHKIKEINLKDALARVKELERERAALQKVVGDASSQSIVLTAKLQKNAVLKEIVENRELIEANRLLEDQSGAKSGNFGQVNLIDTMNEQYQEAKVKAKVIKYAYRWIANTRKKRKEREQARFFSG